MNTRLMVTRSPLTLLNPKEDERLATVVDIGVIVSLFRIPSPPSTFGSDTVLPLSLFGGLTWKMAVAEVIVEGVFIAMVASDTVRDEICCCQSRETSGRQVGFVPHCGEPLVVTAEAL